MNNLSLGEAHDVLSAWIALEVLSPQSFQKPEDLVSGNRELVTLFTNNSLPWENGGEKVSKDVKLSYQVVIGTIDLKKVVSALSEKYSDHYPETSQAQEHAIMAVVFVDQKGCLLEERPSVALSSFAWGAPLALKGSLKELDNWMLEEGHLLKELDELLRRRDEKGNNVPLDRHIMQEAYHFLVNSLEMPEEVVKNTFFAIKAYESSQKSKPQPLLLNSFYLRDLIEAKSSIGKCNGSKNLERYLGIKRPSIRSDILNSQDSLEEAVAPKLIPPARWPGMGRKPLVLLQQAAVNLAFQELKTGGILAVNGPPGTGKTTLLRDIVAGMITQRAESMCKFDDPSTAFAFEKKTKIGSGWFNLYSLDARLKGFEMLIASSNNKAVQNISAELPRLNAIANDADELRYFNILSDKLYGFESWGLIAAVLGNSANRNRFAETFWADKDVGLATYLAEASGLSPSDELKDFQGEKIFERRIPKIIQENNPPENYQEALKRWQQARKDFLSVLTECKSRLEELEKARSVFQYLDSLSQDERDLEKLECLLEDHQKLAPGFFSRFFRFSYARLWKEKEMTLLDKKNKVISASKYREKLGSQVFEKQSFEEEGLHLIFPWCDQEMQLLRDQVFIAAIKLHKAFIDAAAKPLRHNLTIFMHYFSNPSALNGDKATWIPDLWSSLFLVVPCVSTTFASINRMFVKVPQNFLGWLLIDEAGQATPQAAVGAIMRTQRAIIVGDPMQIEPIVQLPNGLTRNICKQFHVDPDRFNAPEASVQTLADSATSYFTEFESMNGCRSVGVPLLVHRRCSEPMFSIANAIAYDRLMVHAKRSGPSSIRECLGPSCWFDVSGQSKDKWCPEEGKKLLELLFMLQTKTAPDLFIVSPFVVVGDRIRKIIKESHILSSWKVQNDYKWLSERVGTVHTMQGREAEAVIFVLGAPSKEQMGARNWAGSKPNLLNVAVTRAKEVIYIIGNKANWSGAGVFKELSNSMNDSI